MHGRCRSFFVPFLLVSLSTFVGLLIVEMSGRVYFLGWKSLSPTLLRSIPYIGAVNVLQPSEARWPPEGLQPNLDTYYQMVPFKTNSHGLRDKEYTVEKPPNTFRIAVIGDSYTLPDGVRIEDAYHSLLEEWLNENSKHWRYELINFGVGGYDLPEYTAVLKEKAIAYSPDLILIAFCSRNDYLPKLHLLSQKKQREVKPLPKARAFYLANLYDKLHAQLLGTQPPPHQGMHLWTTKKFWQPSDEEIEKHTNSSRKALQKIASIAKGYHIPVVLANFDYAPISPKLLGILSESAEKNAMAFIDVSQYFPKGNGLAYTIYRSDPHPNARAHHLFATYLYDFLRKEHLVPL